MTMQRKKLKAELVPSAGGFTATVTTAAIDRDGEVVIPQGMNSTEYESNPVLFWNHDLTLPVGRCVALQRNPDSIVGEFQLAERPADYVGEFFPDFVRAVIGQGVVKGVSIGYVPEQGGTRRATVDDRKRYGDAVHTVYNKWRLMEISVAPLQCNPQALISAVRKGAVDAAAAARWLDYVEPRRVQIVVPVPARTWADAASAARVQPMETNAVVRRELARARGALR
jgi:HK97 family phage prohead protease